MIANSYSITNVIPVNVKRVFPDIRITCNGTITNWIVGLPPQMAASLRHVHLQLRRSTDLITALDMDTINVESMSTNVYNFKMSNETAVEVQNGDQLVIDSTSNYEPIYCLENNGPLNYETDYYSTLSYLPDNNYPLISVMISKCPLMFLLHLYFILLQNQLLLQALIILHQQIYHHPMKILQ